MKTYTDYLFFNTKQRQEFVRITDEEMRRAVNDMTELALVAITSERH